MANFGYLFTEPQPVAPAEGLGGKTRCSLLPSLVTLSCELFFQVYHSAELPFVYGAPNDTSAAATSLSDAMIDYWISFATSLDPNDGRGKPRIISHCFILLL